MNSNYFWVATDDQNSPKMKQIITQDPYIY